MSGGTFQEMVICDGRIAPHATALQPAWLWSADGSAILWTNAAGAAAFGLTDPTRLGEPLGAFDPHRRQVAHLANRLPMSGATRLERMRGFGATPGQLATCSCALLTLQDASHAVLIASLANSGKPLPLAERLQFVLDGFDRPAVALSSLGALLGTNSATRLDFGHFEQFSRPDFLNALAGALREGHAEVALDQSPLALCRVGSGHDVAIVVLMPARELSRDEPLDESFADEVLVEEDETADEAAPIATDNPPPPTDLPTTSAPGGEDIATATTDGSSAAVAAAPASAAGEIAPSKQPLRIIWQMDAETRFSLGNDAFSKLIGPMAAAALGRPWHEIADRFGLDPEQKIANAIASRETWSGIVIDWPMSAMGERMPIEMSGLPLFDRAQNFAGYRGFGICRDIVGLERLADLRRQEHQFGTVHPAPAASAEPGESDRGTAPEERRAIPRADDTVENAPGETVLADRPPVADPVAPNAPQEIAETTDTTAPAQNVVPFPMVNDPRTPALSAVENHAFDEIARRLSGRLNQGVREGAGSEDDDPRHVGDEVVHHSPASNISDAAPAPWLGGTAGTRGESTHDKPLLDRVPTGILIYRLDHLLYANAAFLARTGFASLHALSDAGGLDALYVQPVESSASSSSESGMPLSIATSDTGQTPILARLYTITWDDEPAMALIFSADGPSATDQPSAPQDIAETPGPTPRPPSPAVHDQLASIIEAMADGIVMFDQEGNILSCNRSAEALFNEGTAELTQRNLADLFAPESQSVVLAYFEGLDDPAVTRTMDHGREVLGQVRGGGLIPLAMTMGRTADSKYFAVFRDLSQLKKNEADLLSARRSAERAASLRADVLARINHEIRIPLNAIIGFAEAMIEQRFGPLGTERYLDYMRDIRAAGERVLTIVSDTLNLTRIETGKLELAPVSVNLNDLVAQCVGVLQPQANRERIIIRSSLAPHLPVVYADPPSLRQIVTSLVASSIELANAGGQVIVSTALTDRGDVALRVRDTGRALSERDIKAAVEPYRAAAGDDHAVPDTAGLNLALTKALAEANRAQFSIRNAPQAGTLIEVVFPLAAQAAAGGG